LCGGVIRIGRSSSGVGVITGGGGGGFPSSTTGFFVGFGLVDGEHESRAHRCCEVGVVDLGWRGHALEHPALTLGGTTLLKTTHLIEKFGSCSSIARKNT
jgi:hypothetical protein